MGLEFGTLYGIGMSQDTHPQHTHKAPILDVQLPRKKNRGGCVPGLQYQTSPEEGAQGRDTPGAKSRKVFLSLLGQLFLLTLGLSLLVTSFRK